MRMKRNIAVLRRSEDQANQGIFGFDVEVLAEPS